LAGFLLLTKLDPAKYRLIMAKLDADYFYQAKADNIAEAQVSNERLHRKVISPLQRSEQTTIVLTTEVLDVSNHRIASVKTTWQVKRRDKVRTKV